MIITTTYTICCASRSNFSFIKSIIRMFVIIINTRNRISSIHICSVITS